MIARESWEWFGVAGHLIVADRCRFHLTTRVGRYFVSTVGDYRPDLNRGASKGQLGPIETIGGGEDAFYETLVFDLGTSPRVCSCGCRQPEGVAGYEQVDGRQYPLPGEAAAGHIALCEEWSRA